jgi:hypothetical protein
MNRQDAKNAKKQEGGWKIEDRKSRIVYAKTLSLIFYPQSSVSAILAVGLP